MNRSDRTLPDASEVIEGELRWRALDEPPEIVRRDIFRALAAAGFRVVPIPDDNTVTEIETKHSPDEDRRFVELAVPWLKSPWPGTVTEAAQADLCRVADLLAAAYLDGRPQDRPDRCPTCGSDDVNYRVDVDDGSYYAPVVIPCTDKWHVGGSGDTR